MKLDPIEITPSLMLCVNVEMELARAAQMRGLLSSCGRRFESVPFDEEYPKLNFMDRCYDNAVQVSRSHGLIYCEGILIMRTRYRGSIPLAHGWCCNAAGKVIDPTCHKYQHIPEFSYVGIPFKASYVDWWYKTVGYHGILDGDKHGRAIGVYHDSPTEYLAYVGPKL